MKKQLKYALGIDNNFFPQSLFPSKKYLPDWYKNEKRFTNEKPKIFGINEKNLTYKACIPFFDSLTNGYTVELWTDIFVFKNDNGVPEMRWDIGPDPVVGRDSIKSFTQPHMHDDAHFAWFNPYTIKTPKNYGLLITHPFNRFDLPFTTLTGIADSDKLLTTGVIPFFIKKDFEGVIPCGTPIFQILPFKRESWEYKEDASLIEKNKEQLFMSTRNHSGFYKKNIWKRIMFN